MINHTLEQMVKIPTRINNILDLFLTNIQSQVHETKTLPGLGTSDHDIVFHEIKIKRGRIKQNPRQVKSYKKANWSDFKTWPSSLTRSQHTNTKTQTTSGPCLKLKSTGYPPYTYQRQIKSGADLPWVTHAIVKLIRKRDKLYTKLKRSCSHL